MPDLGGHLLHEGVSVDITFALPGPGYGDLFQICGHDHPSFPPSGAYLLGTLADLGFSQLEDYFGIKSQEQVGDDVVVWLYPLLKGVSAHQRKGSCDGVRLNFNVLRNGPDRADLFYRCIEGFAGLGIKTVYVSRNVDLGLPPNLAPVRADVEAIVEHWRERGVEVGSDPALAIDY